MSYEPANSVESRVRNLEIWRPSVDAEVRSARDALTKFVPIVEALMSEDRLEKALTVALNNTQTQAWTRRERVMGLAAFVVLLLNLAITLYIVF